MSATLIILAIVGVAFFGLLIFSRDFRNWLGDTLTAIGLLILDAIPAIATWLREALRIIGRIIGIYSMVLAGVTVFALILIIIALLINSPGFTAFAFVLAISLFLLSWLPAGIVMKVFRVTKAVVPQQLRFIIAWVAFIGFLGMVHPDALTWKSLMGFALFGFIWMATSAKFNAIDRLIFPLVIIMCLAAGWEHFFPESYRSTTRYAISWSKSINASKDRGSINNETNAATTYGVILRDVNTLYELKNLKNGVSDLTEISRNLSRGTIVKFVSHKQEVKEIDGQGFVQIQLAKANGSFVKGEKRWIEAEFVQIATPREVTPKDDSLLSANKQAANSSIQAPDQTSMVKDSIFTRGVYTINVKGQTPFNIVVVSSQGVDCHRYSLQSPTWNYQILIPGMNPIQAGPTAALPYLQHPVFKLASQSGDTVTLTVV